jgi:hypothetical protein
MPGECKIRRPVNKRRNGIPRIAEVTNARWGLDEAEKTKHPPNEVESSMLKSQMLKEVAATRREKRSRTNTPDKMGITGTPR